MYLFVAFLLMAFRGKIDFLDRRDLACLALVKSGYFKANGLSQFSTLHGPSMVHQTAGMPNSLNRTICAYQSGDVRHLSLDSSQDCFLTEMPFVNVFQIQQVCAKL